MLIRYKATCLIVGYEIGYRTARDQAIVFMNVVAAGLSKIKKNLEAINDRNDAA